MISDNQKFRLPDMNHKSEFVIEVNWNPKDPKTNECQVVKLTAPSGEETYIKREHLHSVLFAIGKAAEQAQLVPQKRQTIRNIETVLGIKASKDIFKGEMINVRVKIPVPLGEEEVIIDRSPQPSPFIT